MNAELAACDGNAAAAVLRHVARGKWATWHDGEELPDHRIPTPETITNLAAGSACRSWGPGPPRGLAIGYVYGLAY